MNERETWLTVVIVVAWSKSTEHAFVKRAAK